MKKLLAALSVSFTFLATPAMAADGSPQARTAAQKGLRFLTTAASAWQKQNNCYGCHVQAVTIEALSVGRHHQYAISAKDLEVLRASLGMLGSGAAVSYPATSHAFAASAAARYDAYVDAKERDHLIEYARKLMGWQDEDGSVRPDHEGRPVTAGRIQATYQAMAAWRQAFSRTADDAWLAPLRRAESYVQARAATYTKDTDLQDTAYALMALRAAGAGKAEAQAGKLVKLLLGRQAQDGSWDGQAFFTGQALYALRMAGLGDGDPAVARGTRWLVARQQEDGGWGAAGSGKAEAMWGVLGLVSVDVLNVGIAGIEDGAHVGDSHHLVVEAADNNGGAVAKVELYLDDVLVKTAKGGTLAHDWDTRTLGEGRHLIDAIAYNGKGGESRRRIEVYAGNVFFTQLATRFVNGEGTQITARNIAPAGRTGDVRVEVLAPDGKKAIWDTAEKSRPGSVSFLLASDKAKRGRYTARMSFRAPDGAVLQKEEIVFFHDTQEAQKAQYAEVQGSLSVRGGGAANTKVDLVDDSGRVVQSTVTTEDGNWRFKNVDQGKYKVRVRKEGFKDMEQEIAAEKSRESAAAPMALH